MLLQGCGANQSSWPHGDTGINAPFPSLLFPRLGLCHHACLPPTAPGHWCGHFRSNMNSLLKINWSRLSSTHAISCQRARSTTSFDSDVYCLLPNGTIYIVNTRGGGGTKQGRVSHTAQAGLCNGWFGISDLLLTPSGCWDCKLVLPRTWRWGQRAGSRACWVSDLPTELYHSLNVPYCEGKILELCLG